MNARNEIETVLCDLDGVVWLAHHPIAGSVEAIAALQASGRRVLLVTNNSSATIATQERALADVGISATGDVVSSALAAALLRWTQVSEPSSPADRVWSRHSKRVG